MTWRAVVTRIALCLLASHIASSSVWAEPTRPLIVIPGILGSRLVNPDGELVWGGVKSYSNFTRTALPRDDTLIELQPDGIIESVPIVWPWKIKQYDGLMKTLDDLGYQKGINLFVFSYDWRRSNFKTAELLEAFVQQRPQLRDHTFDILAHSMGGLVATIFVHKQPSGPRVRRLVTFGTPFFGSLNALDTLIGGFTGLSGFLTEIGSTTEQVREVMFSFESGYELLPSYQNCCILGLPDSPTRTPTSLLEMPFWNDEWLTESLKEPVARAFISTGLARAAELADLVRQPLPSHVALYMFAGDKFETRTRVYVRDDGAVARYDHLGGDGTVWLTSAARNAVADSRVSLAKHARIFDDLAARAALRRILVPTGELEDFAATASSVEVQALDGSMIEVDLVTFSATPAIVRTGSTVSIQLRLAGPAIESSEKQFGFEACAAAPNRDTSCFVLEEGAQADDGRSFVATPTFPGSGSYTVTLRGFSTIEDYFVVMEGS